MIKEMISELNRAMYENEISFDCVENLLEQLSKLTGKKYGILHRRVTVYSENGAVNDAWATA